MSSTRKYPSATNLLRIWTPREGLFLAAKAYRRYRARGGSRTGVLSDFFIGAHAATADYTLLTRDPVRYRGYFPTIRMIIPH
jgi:predicted nucleic acid-binding protein